jgi:hypothetical protein
MTFVDRMIRRRHFEARYNQVGRAMLADLADMFSVDFDLAARWADEIDREPTIRLPPSGCAEAAVLWGMGRGGDPQTPMPKPVRPHSINQQ